MPCRLNRPESTWICLVWLFYLISLGVSGILLMLVNEKWHEMTMMTTDVNMDLEWFRSKLSKVTTDRGQSSKPLIGCFSTHRSWGWRRFIHERHTNGFSMSRNMRPLRPLWGGKMVKSATFILENLCLWSRFLLKQSNIPQSDFV